MTKRTRNQVVSKTDPAQKNLWQTTDEAYADARFLCGVRNQGFHKDVAASESNKRCPLFIDEKANALSNQAWLTQDTNTIWCNPPFDLKRGFLAKAYDEVCRFSGSGLVCMMIPFEPATVWWAQYVDKRAHTVYVPDGRYYFIDPVTQKPVKNINFPSAFVVFSTLATDKTQYVHFKRGIGSHLL